MEKKNVTEVVIGGKIYKLGGYESEDYLHQVASYLNNRITELRSLEGYHRLPSAQKSLMLDLNTADDYFKAKKQVERLEADLSQKDRELYEIRHELVSAEVKLEESQKQITSLKEEEDDYLKRIALLEARLSRPGEGTGNLAQDLQDQKGKE
jgi:cell division protein ZapA